MEKSFFSQYLQSKTLLLMIISLCVKKYSHEKWLSPSADLSYCPGSSLKGGWNLVQFIAIAIKLQKKKNPSRSNTDLNRSDARAEIRLWGWISPSVVRAVKPSSRVGRLFYFLPAETATYFFFFGRGESACSVSELHLSLCTPRPGGRKQQQSLEHKFQTPLLPPPSTATSFFFPACGTLCFPEKKNIYVPVDEMDF